VSYPGSPLPLVNATLGPTTPNRKRKRSMVFRSGQSGYVSRKGQMWHGRYYVDLPGKDERRRVSVPLGSVSTMKKTEAKRKLRAMLEGRRRSAPKPNGGRKTGYLCASRLVRRQWAAIWRST
jgi:hypothetical protein